MKGIECKTFVKAVRGMECTICAAVLYNYIFILISVIVIKCNYYENKKKNIFSKPILYRQAFVQCIIEIHQV